MDAKKPVRQLFGIADNRPVSVKNHAIQLMADNSKQVLNQKALQLMADNSRRVNAVAQLIAKANNPPSYSDKSGLPAQLKSGVESLSGISMDDVKVHYNSSKPAQLSAHAYAQGNNIHLASGQEKHLPHEAWHVVQQKQGRVKPTLQMKGEAINDDKNLENEADLKGKEAINQGQSATQLKQISDSGSSNSTIQRVLAANPGGKELAFVKLVNRILKGHYKLAYNSHDHSFSLQRTGGAKTELATDAEKLRSVLANIIANGNTTTINFAEMDNRVYIGGFDQETIDISDVKKFGVFKDSTHKGITAASALVHELHEQFRKQVHHDDLEDAHFDHAIPAEEEAIEGFREGSTPKEYIGESLTNYTQKSKYSYLDGTVVIVTVTVINANITDVKRNKYKNIIAFRKSPEYDEYDSNMDDEEVIRKKVGIYRREVATIERKIENAKRAIARLPATKRINGNRRTNPQLQKRRREKESLEAELPKLKKLLEMEEKLLSEFDASESESESGSESGSESESESGSDSESENSEDSDSGNVG